jgi:hypothetical protein
MTVAAPLVRRSVFDRVGMFDEGLDRLEDWQLWLRCAVAGVRFTFLESTAPVAMIRVHGASLSSRLVPMLQTEIPMRKRLQPTLPTQAARDLNQRRIDEVSAALGKLIALGGDVQGGLRYLLPAAIKQRRRAWFLWIFEVLIVKAPGGSGMLRALRSCRHRGIVAG